MTKADSTKYHYFGALLEDIQSKQDFILEVVSGLAGLPEAMASVKDDIQQIKSDLRIIKKDLQEIKLIKPRI